MFCVSQQLPSISLFIQVLHYQWANGLSNVLHSSVGINEHYNYTFIDVFRCINQRAPCTLFYILAGSMQKKSWVVHAINKLTPNSCFIPLITQLALFYIVVAINEHRHCSPFRCTQWWTPFSGPCSRSLCRVLTSLLHWTNTIRSAWICVAAFYSHVSSIRPMWICMAAFYSYASSNLMQMRKKKTLYTYIKFATTPHSKSYGYVLNIQRPT